MKKQIIGLVMAAAVSALSLTAMAADDHSVIESSHVHDGVTVTEFEFVARTVLPTCTEKGIDMYVCSDPGHPDQKWYHEVTVDALGHSYGDWVVTKEPTCTEDGTSERKCTVCGAVDTEILPRPTDPSSSSEKYHNWDKWVIEKAPTCSEEGLKVRWCKRSCGAKEYEIIPKLDPEWVEVSKVVTDCEHITYTYKCAHCNGKVAGHIKTETVAASSHAYVHSKDYEIERVEPTCENDGYVIYKCRFEDTYPNIEHPTETIKLPAKGHKWSAWVKRHEPGEQDNEYGYWLRECTVCGKTEEKISAEDPDAPVVVKNGIVHDEDGVYRYYTDGEVDKEFAGIVEYEGGEFFVANGEVCMDAMGLNQNVDGKWYFLSQGQIQRVDGFAEYDYNWFMLKNGELDLDANGIYDYDGGRFAFAAGKLRTDISGLWQNPVDGDFYYLSNGQVADYTGVVEYDGAFFYVVNGKLASFYNGTVLYDGAKFNVVAGQLYDQVK